MSSILKYFMKPKAEDYTLPDAEEMTNQLEEMLRFKESIPTEESVKKTKKNSQKLADIMDEQPADSYYDSDMSDDENGKNTEIADGSITFAHAQAEAIVRDAHEEAEKIIAQAKLAAEAEVAKIQQEALEEGFSRGYQEGKEKARQEAAESIKETAKKATDEIERFMNNAMREREKAIDGIREELLEVAVTIAEKVIHVSLKSSREVIRRMIIAATEKLKRREWVQIYVADCDVKGATQTDPMLAAALSSLSDHVKIVPMRDAETGTCIVEMPDEIIDASASTQLQNIRTIIRES